MAGDDGRLFTVGDEFQSIYGFRHADVDVFREFRAAAAEHDRVRPLTENFRSRPEILETLNAVFGPHWADEFQPLRPGGDGHAASPDDQLQLDLNGSTPARGGTAVELIVTDLHAHRWKPLGDAPFGESLAVPPAWRAAEMRLLADRIRRLVDEGRDPAEIVVLLRAAVDMPLYERALRERGIETYVVGGRNYWAQQQVADLRGYLAVLANPLDQAALYTTLGSPLGGLSLDALALLGLQARRLRRDPWWALSAEDGSDGLHEKLPADDRDRAADAVRRIEEHRRLAGTLSLERLLDRIITDGGYDRTLLALPDGRRRMANVRKLMRLARQFEADRGADLRGFIDYLAEQDLLAAREGEAPLEAEDLQAVRLMTIHAAKGLEFPVVCVADLGRSGRGDDDALRVTDDGRVGLKIASLGGGSTKGLGLEEIAKEQDLLQDEEERRIFYVAMTRAQELLVLSGATDVEKWPAEQPLGVPMNWIWRGVAPGLDAGAAGGVPAVVCTPDNVDELLDEPARYGEAIVGEEAAVPTGPLRAFERHEAAPALPVGRLSYSGLARYRACGYRFYLERVVGLHELAATPEGAQVDQPGAGRARAAPARDRGARAARAARLLGAARAIARGRGGPARVPRRRLGARRGRGRAPVRHRVPRELALRAPRSREPGSPGARVRIRDHPAGDRGEEPARERLRGRVRGGAGANVDRGLQDGLPRGHGCRRAGARRATRSSASSMRWPPCARARPPWRSPTASSSGRTR